MLKPSRRIKLEKMFLDEISADEKSAEDKVEISPRINPMSKTMFVVYNALRSFLIERKTIASN